MRVYIDGVWDMFHVGHLKCLLAARKFAEERPSPSPPEVVVGVVSDEDAASYKRTPVIPHDERAAIVAALGCVAEVIPRCPLRVTPEFLREHRLQKVVHGFSNDADRARQRPFFADIADAFEEIPYTHGISTTDVLARVQQRVAGAVVEGAAPAPPALPLLQEAAGTVGRVGWRV